LPTLSSTIVSSFLKMVPESLSSASSLADPREEFHAGGKATGRASSCA
jgi:hypothetical protein